MSNEITVVTNYDLARQGLSLDGSLREVTDPCHSLDPRLARELNRKGLAPAFQYDGVKTVNRRSPRYPNVTMNHFAVGRVLRESQAMPKRFFDLGCGVGFNGNYAAAVLGTQEIVFADLNLEAINDSVASYGLNHPEIDLVSKISAIHRHKFGGVVHTGKHSLDLRVGDAIQTLSGMGGDYASISPMFVPGICEIFPQAYNLFAGIAKGLGARLFVGHSALALQWVEDAATTHKMDLIPRFEKRIPLRLDYSDSGATLNGVLPPALEDNLRPLGLELSEEPNGPRYYHKLMVTELR